MNQQVWYFYQNNQQIGPFDAQQVNQLISTNMIAQDGYVFKVGWKDWRPLEEAIGELGLDGGKSAIQIPSLSPELAEIRRQKAPRASVKGRVVLHNNSQLTIGDGVNVSESGMFIETEDSLFTVGETLKLSVRADGLEKAFNADALVIRFNKDSQYPIGYGLQFTDIPDRAKHDIRNLVEQLNKSIKENQ